mgnify:CR=1 FL=1
MKRFGRLYALHLLHDAWVHSLFNESLLQQQCNKNWVKCGDLYFTPGITYVATIYKTIVFFEWIICTYPYTSRAHGHHCFYTSLACILFHVKWGFGAQAKRLVNYECFGSKKFTSLRIILHYNASHSIKFDFDFPHIFSLGLIFMHISFFQSQSTIPNCNVH